MLGKLCLEGVIIIFFFPFPFPIRFSVSLSYFFFFQTRRDTKRVCGECLYEDFLVGL